MAQFDASIDLNVKVERALAAIDRVERRVARLSKNAEVDLKVKNAQRVNQELKNAEKTTRKLAKALAGIESKTLSKLPTSLQTVIAFLKASVAASKDLAFTLAGVGNETQELTRDTAGYTREILSAALALGKVANEQERLGKVRQLSSGRGAGFLENAISSRTAIRDQLVPGTEEYERITRQILNLRSALNANLRQQEDIEKRILGYQVQQRNAVEANIRASKAAREGSGFAAFSQESPQDARRRRAIDQVDQIKDFTNEYVDALDTVRTTANRNNIAIAEAEAKRINDLYELRADKEDELFRLRNKLNAAAERDFDKRLNSRVKKREQRERQIRERRNAGGQALTGFAFPLLFGGGPGAAVGGALGGGIGGLIGGQFGLGLSLLLSEVGSLFDQLAGKSLTLAKSLLDVENSLTTLSKESLTLSRAREKELKALSDSGLSIEASIKAQEDLAEILGTRTVNNLRNAGEAFDQLGREFAETIARLGAALDQSGVLKFINDRLAEFNQTAALSSDVFAAQKVAREQGTAEDRRLSANIVARFLTDGAEAEKEIREELAKLADRLPAINVKLNLPTSEQLKLKQQIEGIQTQLNLVSSQQTLFGFIEKFGKQAEETDRKRKRAAQEVKRAEEQIADLRLSLERQVEDLRLSALQQAARLEEARAETLGAKLRNELTAAGLELQRSLDFDDPARDLKIGLQEALAEYQVRIFDIQAQEEKLRRDAFLREEQLRLRTQRIIADAEKTISDLKIKTAEKVKEINEETSKLQTDAAKAAFELDKKAALLQISLIEKQAKLERLRLSSAEDFAVTYEPLLNDIDKAIKKSRDIVNNSKFEDVVPGAAAGSGAGTEGAGVSGGIDDIIADIQSINAEIKNLGIAIDAEISEKLKQDAVAAFLQFQQKVIQLTDSVEKLESPLKSRLQTLRESVRSEALIREGFRSSDVGTISKGIAEFEKLERTLRANAQALEQYREIAKAALEPEQYAQLSRGIDQVLGRIGKRLDELPEKVKLFLASFDKDDPIGDYIKNLNDQLANTDQMIVDIASSIEGVLAGSISSMVSGLVDGTRTVEESISEMFAGIGKAFLDMAAQMLAQQLVLTILKSFSSGISPSQSLKSGFNMGTGLADMLRADGGPVSGGNPYIVGERGPELFLPTGSGTVVSSDDLFNATRAAVSGSGSSSSAAFDENASVLTSSNQMTRERVLERERIQAMNSNPIEVRTDSTVINRVEYVTVEQLAISNKQTAREAQARTLSDLKNRPATRAQIGLR